MEVSGQGRGKGNGWGGQYEVGIRGGGIGIQRACGQRNERAQEVAGGRRLDGSINELTVA